jgi:hypothetical protein
MSELTPCNYCSLQEIKRLARKRGEAVEVVHGAGEMKGWLQVKVGGKPKDIWFRALTDSCAC